ncbi:MAG: DUF4314 domain-containing protein [Clostridia bacterium]|nr:DUF4314 domain-containing protein [Clostridia bacterium]
MTSSEKLKQLRDTYKTGVRVRLINMYDEPQMAKGLEGTVEHIDDIGQIHVRWDNGSGLALIVGADLFEIIK